MDFAKNINDMKAVEVKEYANELQEKVAELATQVKELNEQILQNQTKAEQLSRTFKNSEISSGNIQTYEAQAKKITGLLENLHTETKDSFDALETKFNDSIETANREYQEVTGKNNALHEKQKADFLSMVAKIDDEREEINTINEKSQELLQSLSDGTIHGTFKAQAEKMGSSASSWRIASVVLGLLAIAVIGFATWHIFNTTSPSFTIIGVRILFTLAILPILSWLIYFSSKQSSILGKQGDEYTHKATVLEAITGYRKHFALTHSDEEFIQLFDAVIEELLKNPSETVNKLYGLENIKKTKSLKQKSNTSIINEQYQEEDSEDDEKDEI